MKMIQHLPPEPNEIWPLRHISMKVMKMEIRDTVKLEIWRGIKFWWFGSLYYNHKLKLAL